MPLYLVSMDPSKDWLTAPLSDFDLLGDSSSSGHQYQRKFNKSIILIGRNLLLQHADHCPVGFWNWNLGDSLYGAWPVYPGVFTLPA